MIDWSLNPKKPLFGSQPVAPTTKEEKQEGPLTTSKLANGAVVDAAEKVKAQLATAPVTTAKTQDDLLDDSDDLDALEALATEQDDLSALNGNEVHKEDVIVEQVKQD